MVSRRYYDSEHMSLLCLPERVPILELLDKFKKENSVSKSQQLFMLILDRFQFPQPEDHHEIKNELKNMESKGDNALIVGLAYQFRLGVEKDLSKAFKNYSQYEQYPEPLRGIMAAQLGECYLFGLGTFPDTTQAYQLFAAESKNNNPVAIKYLAFCYQYGLGSFYYPPNIRENNYYELKRLQTLSAQWGIPELKDTQDNAYNFEAIHLAQLELAINLGSTPALTAVALLFPRANPFFHNLLNISVQRKEPVALVNLIDLNHEEKNDLNIQYLDELKIIFDNISSRFLNYNEGMRKLLARYLDLTFKLANFFHENGDKRKSLTYLRYLTFYDKPNWRRQFQSLINFHPDEELRIDSFFRNLAAEIFSHVYFKLALLSRR